MAAWFGLKQRQLLQYFKHQKPKTQLVLLQGAPPVPSTAPGPVLLRGTAALAATPGSRSLNTLLCPTPALTKQEAVRLMAPPCQQALHLTADAAAPAFSAEHHTEAAHGQEHGRGGPWRRL